MSPPAPVDGPDRGRTVVWSAGSVLVGPRRAGRGLGRRLGLVALVAAAAFALAYAVHSVAVLTPPPTGPAAPLWLPEQLPAAPADGSDPDDRGGHAPGSADDPGHENDPADDSGGHGRGSVDDSGRSRGSADVADHGDDARHGGSGRAHGPGS